MGNNQTRDANAWFGDGPDNDLLDNMVKSKSVIKSLYPQNISINAPIDNFQKSEGNPIIVNFSLNENNTILSFHFDYNGDIVNGEVHSDGYVKSNNFILVEKVNNTQIIRVITVENLVLFQFLINDFTNLNTIQWTTLGDSLKTNAPTTCNIVNSSLKKLLEQNTLSVELFCQTDKYGLNLGELGGIVDDNKSHPNGYPKELIGTCDKFQQVTNLGVQTFYSFRPKLNKVLKGNGNTLFAQTNDINSMFNTGLTDCEFYLNILAYSTYRYMLAGLSNNGDFSCKWLYANNYDKFLRNLKNSEFSAAIVIFTEPQPCGSDFTNFNRYFINCPHK
jgi:hypothetical protein